MKTDSNMDQGPQEQLDQSSFIPWEANRRQFLTKLSNALIGGGVLFGASSVFAGGGQGKGQNDPVCQSGITCPYTCPSSLCPGGLACPSGVCPAGAACPPLLCPSGLIPPPCPNPPPCPSSLCGPALCGPSVCGLSFCTGNLVCGSGVTTCPSGVTTKFKENPQKSDLGFYGLKGVF